MEAINTTTTLPEKIVKRHGSIVLFDANKIRYAIQKALVATDVTMDDNSPLALSITEAVCSHLPPFPTVEQCQDIVEEELMKAGLIKTAKAYILYREKRSHLREQAISETWRAECKEAVKYFPTVYNYIVYLRTYSKFLDSKGRRETWPETVIRFMDFMRETMRDKLYEEEYKEIHEAILRMDVMPSMRMLQFAGEAVRRNNICSYNCAYITLNKIEAFRDALMILMSGSGQGYSIEKKYVNQLPIIKKQTGETLPTHTIEDSREGWCCGFYYGLVTWYEGKDITFDYSKVRPAGARLKISGGRASGPAPLKELLDFAREIILSKQGDRLTTINVHDLMCKIGHIVVVGGVRRCLAVESRILTKFGSFKAIQDIKVGEQVMTNNGWKPVLNVFEQGEQEVIKIKHINGYIECTPNHRMAVLTDVYGNFKWKEAVKLEEGDILGFPMFDENGNYLSKVKICINKLPKFNYIRPKNSTTCKDIIIPTLDREMAWFIGHFQGNGHVYLTSKGGELSDCVHGDKREEAKFIAEQFKRFDINVGIQEPHKDNYCIKIRVKSKQLATYFHEHVKQPKTSMYVPQFIKNASTHIKAAFLQGLLDANGSVTGSFKLVTTVYEEYAKDIQNLCYSMNIISRMVFRKVEEDKWDVELPNRRDKEMFNILNEGIGYEKITRFGSMYGCSWPIEMFQFKNDKALGDWNMSGSIAYDTASTLIDIPFVPIKVEDIIREGKIVPTYDIEVEDNHCFVCEGLLTHNSSEISLSDLDDDEMRDAKKGAFWEHHPDRCMANNSAVYNEIPTDEELDKEWKSLVASGSGERGIFSRSSLHVQLPTRRLEVIGDRYKNMGTNPCVAGCTWVMTVEGPRQVYDLIDKSLDLIVNGVAYSMESKGFFHTGIKDVYLLETYMGLKLYLTNDHPLMQNKGGKLVKTKLSDLKENDEVLLSNHRGNTDWEGPGTFSEGWLIGQMVGNDNDNEYREFWEESAKESSSFRSDMKVYSLGMSEKKNLLSQLEKTSSQFYKGFLRGFFNIDSEIIDSEEEGYSLRHSDSNLWGLQVVQRMLLRLGMVSKIYQNGRKGDKKEHELVLNKDNIPLFYELIGSRRLENIVNAPKVEEFHRETFKDKIRSITLFGETDVYDVTVANVHEFCANGIRVHNCGEQLLLPNEFCNLTTITCRPQDDRESLLRKIRISTIIGTFQSSLDKFPIISPEWKENAILERLMGVSMTGQRDCNYLQQNLDVLNELKNMAIETNRIYADRFGINRSTAITTTKPEGTSSEMLGVSNGVHARFAPYYIRRIRISATDPLAKLLIDQAVPYNPENGQTRENANTWVFEFPQKSPEGSVMISDLTAIDQLNYWKEVKTRYTEHNPSTTIHVKENEWDIVLEWLKKNWSIVGGLSFLPYSDHIYKLAPFEAISEEEYKKRVREFPEIDFAKLILYEKSDTTERKAQWACVGDKCSME